MLDKDPSGLKVLANKTNSEVSKPLVAVEKSHHHHDRNIIMIIMIIIIFIMIMIIVTTITH